MKTTFTFGMMLILMSVSSCFLTANSQEKQSMKSLQALNKTMPCKVTSEPVPGAEIIVDLASGQRATCQTNEHGIFAIYLSNSNSGQSREKTVMVSTSITPPQNLHSTIANKNIELKLNEAEGNYFEFQLLGEQAASNSQTCKLTILPLQSKKINKAEEIPLENGSHSGGQKRGEVAQF